MSQLPSVILVRNFQQPGYFGLHIEGDVIQENETLTVSEVLALLSEANIIEYHELTMIHDDPRECDSDDDEDYTEAITEYMADLL